MSAGKSAYLILNAIRTTPRISRFFLIFIIDWALLMIWPFLPPCSHFMQRCRFMSLFSASTKWFNTLFTQYCWPAVWLAVVPFPLLLITTNFLKTQNTHAHTRRSTSYNVAADCLCCTFATIASWCCLQTAAPRRSFLRLLRGNIFSNSLMPFFSFLPLFLCCTIFNHCIENPPRFPYAV